MAQYGYSAGYQGGGPSSVPSGYIEAYAQAGRNLGQGVQAIGNVIGESLQRYGQNKEENQFLTARLESLAPYLQTVAQSGNIMDKNTPESKLLGDIEKFSSMSIPQKKATLLNAEFYLDRADKQRAREIQDIQAEAARFNLQTAQGAEARRLGLEQAISQVAQLPATQEVTVPAPPAIISSSLNIPAEQQPYTPFYQVQQVMGGQQQQPDVAAFAQGLGRPVTRIPQRIPIADQPLTAAPAPVPQPLVSTQRVPLRDRQVLQQQQAARPVGIAPIPQREVPAFESQPIQRTVTETQPVGYQDRFKQAVDVFQRLGAPINPEAIRSVLEATGTPRPIQVDTQTLPGGITVVRADGKVDILPAPKMVEGKDLTEGQAKDAMFAARMTYNEGVINNVLSGGYKPGGIFEFGFTPERLKSGDRKTYESSKENWIEANLRDLSGAAIGTDEYKKADLQYFPQAGDSAKQVQQKAKLRKIVENSLRAGVGRNADFYIQQILGGAQEGQTQGGVRKYNPVTKRIE